MSEKAENKQRVFNPNEMVEYMAPLIPGSNKRDVFVAVNGETLRIKRGVKVMIKRKFYNALRNASDQEFAAYQAMEKIQKQGEKPMANI